MRQTVRQSPEVGDKKPCLGSSSSFDLCAFSTWFFSSHSIPFCSIYPSIHSALRNHAWLVREQPWWWQTERNVPNKSHSRHQRRSCLLALLVVLLLLLLLSLSISLSLFSLFQFINHLISFSRWLLYVVTHAMLLLEIMMIMIGVQTVIHTHIYYIYITHTHYFLPPLITVIHRLWYEGRVSKVINQDLKPQKSFFLFLATAF